MKYEAKTIEKIKVNPEAVKHLMRVFKCSSALVSMSLDGSMNGDTSRKIRHVAMTQLGGVKVMDVKWVKKD